MTACLLLLYHYEVTISTQRSPARPNVQDIHACYMPNLYTRGIKIKYYEGRTESHEQLFFACELGTADEGECGGRWNQLLCYP